LDTTLNNDIERAVQALKQGELIAYPTEAVYGIGCDPKQSNAIKQLIKAKKRNPDKGLILIASSFSQLAPYLADIDQQQANYAKLSWPGPVTWVWPVKANNNISSLLTGKHHSIAVRVTNHPIAAALCDVFDGAIVSSSANLEGEEPAKNAQAATSIFLDKIAVVVNGELGDLEQPTKIYDVITREALR